MRTPLPPLPSPAEKRIAIRVKPAAERALRRGHPWLYAESIRHQSHDGRPGDLAVIFDRKRRFLAIGLYDSLSPIRVRLLGHGAPTPIDAAWFHRRVEAAVQIRESLPQTGTTGYRLVHGENDGLPGLVVDRYDRTLVLKLYTVAWVPHLRDVLAALTAVLSPKQIVLRLSRAVQAQESYLFGLYDGQLLWGSQLDNPVRFLENGLTFEADVIRGQKTGFFLDQRHNRARVEALSAGKRVLNVFAYTGGFSLYAARGGATQVLSLDSSRPALEAAGQNFQLNRAQPAVAAATHEILVGDAFHSLKQLQDGRHLFDLVVMDPPSLAKRQSEVEGALAAYGRLVRLGLDVLQPGGILVMASCSSQVKAATFFDTIHHTAATLGRPLQEIEHTGHALDHPIRFAEGAYLKCLFARDTGDKE